MLVYASNGRTGYAWGRRPDLGGQRWRCRAEDPRRGARAASRERRQGIGGAGGESDGKTQVGEFVVVNWTGATTTTTTVFADGNTRLGIDGQ